MKIKVLSRNDAEWSGRVDGTPNVSRQSKNTTPSLHAPQRPLDLQRAITAAKITRTLARPFLFTCSPSHIDGIYGIAKSRNDISLFSSISGDGEIKLWNMITHKPLFSFTPKPAAFIRGVTFSYDSKRLLFCSDAKIIHSINVDERCDENDIEGNWVPDSLKKYLCNSGVPACICSSYTMNQFATGVSETIQVWDEVRSKPLSTLSLGNSTDSIHCIEYNPIETNIIASSASDRSISLYDIRSNTPIRKLVLSHRTNDLSWNPIEAMTLSAANDDHNIYSYDIRKLSNGAVVVHKDHTAAVMSIDYNPTGQEIVSGGYDKMIRIFKASSGRSRESYHTKRMQKVFAVRFSLDGGYVVSGSDDGDIRTWKSERSRPLKPLFHNEKLKIQTSEGLIDRYRHVDVVRRIAMKRHVPKHVKFMQMTKGIMKRSQKRKDDNVKRHTRTENRKQFVPDRKSNIVKELE